jgi:phenylpyruvate tautomerase PptA (4-oxalocrotonate tautomerase family)
MPTYVCELPPGRFNAQKKEQIAIAISHRHSEATGAPPFFVQVIVEDTRADRYLGGQLTGEHVWVRGDIRAGRTEGARTEMMLKIMQDVSRITGINSDNIWVYVCNLEPTDMVEYGHVLPRPGEEGAWFDNLPTKLQAYLSGLGVTRENFRL